MQHILHIIIEPVLGTRARALSTESCRRARARAPPARDRVRTLDTWSSADHSSKFDVSRLRTTHRAQWPGSRCGLSNWCKGRKLTTQRFLDGACTCIHYTRIEQGNPFD